MRTPRCASSRTSAAASTGIPTSSGRSPHRWPPASVRGGAGAAPAGPCLRDLPPERVPMALAGRHRALAVGEVLELTAPVPWRGEALADVLVGAGFTVDEIAGGPGADRDGPLVTRAIRA